MVDVTGVDHVCMGTDTKMTPSYHPPGSFNPPQQDHPDNNPRQTAPPDSTHSKNNFSGDKNRGRMGERTNDAWQNQTGGFYYAVVDALLKTGFSEKGIAKIGGGNSCRIFQAATSGQ